MNVTDALKRVDQWSENPGTRPTPQVGRAVGSALADHVRALHRLATGRLHHSYQGGCPDGVTGSMARDPKCPACRALMVVENALSE
jgi:hypothetical protein